MTKHAGRDQKTRAKFHIVGFDAATGMVELHHSPDGWVKDASDTEHMSWMDFLQGLMDGRFEIHPTKDTPHQDSKPAP